MDVLATLHLADLYRDPKMRIPTRADWAKIPAFLAGRWPIEVPNRVTCIGGQHHEERMHYSIIPWMTGLAPATRIVIDTEYVPHKNGGGRLLTIGIGWRQSDGQIVGFQVDRWPLLGLGARLEFSLALQQFVATHRVVFQNTLADTPVLSEGCGLTFPDAYKMGYDDTMLAHAVLWSEWPHDLGFLESMYSPYRKMKHLGQGGPEARAWVTKMQAHLSAGERLSSVRPSPISGETLPLVGQVGPDQSGVRGIVPGTEGALRDLREAGLTSSTFVGPLPQDEHGAGSSLLEVQRGDWSPERERRSGQAIPSEMGLDQQAALAYNWGDVLSTLVAWEHLDREFQADPKSHQIYLLQSLKLLPELYRAKRRGIRVNGPRVEPAWESTKLQIEQASQLAKAHVGWPINMGSSQHLQRYLYDQMGYKVQTHKKTRRPTIDEDAIATLRGQVGVAPDPEEAEEGLSFSSALERCRLGADPILEARVIYSSALQIQSHYLEPARRALAGDGRFYPDQLIHAQASGRWSTNDPPLAQLPSDLRDIICADMGQVWLGWDWDQIELRINAALSGDTPSIEAFARGWDIHTLNVCDLFGLAHPPNRLDPHTNADPLQVQWRADTHWQGKDDLRRVFAKRFVYRLDYGGDPARAGDIPGAKALGLTSALLVRASNRYLAQHPQKAEWRRHVATEANTTRVSRTFCGRRRRLLGDGRKAIREAFNQPMQGGVVDIFNTTYVQITEQLPWLGWVYGMHDSQNWSCPIERVAATVGPLRAIVEQVWDIAGVKTVFPATFKPKGLFK